MAARTPAHRRKRDPYGRAILAPRIPPPAPAPVAVRTEAEEDWPSPPVPLPSDVTTYWHYTCNHSRAAIGDEGQLLPASQLAPATRVEKLPAWRQHLMSLIWMTDLEAPDARALGLTRETISCDRTVHRYRVYGYKPIRYVDLRRDLPKRLRDLLESADGARPMHWWFAYTPVPVRYEPIVPLAGAR